MTAVTVPLVGNIATDVEVQSTPKGSRYVRFRVATNERYRDTAGEWQSRDAVFWDCEAWNEQADAIAASLTKGSATVLIGTMRSQSWKTDEGEPRTRRYLKVEAIGPNVAAVKRQGAEPTADAPATPDAADEWAAES